MSLLKRALLISGSVYVGRTVYQLFTGKPAPSFILGQIVKIPQLADIGLQVAKMSRGYRNNNAGNLRHSSSKWEGMRGVQDDPNFVQFTAPEFGVRAAGITLRTYFNKYGLNTVLQIITRYAPSSDNNPTTNYAEYVATSMGIDMNTPFNVTQHDNMIALLTGIFKFENNGVMAYSYTFMNDTLKKYGVTHV